MWSSLIELVKKDIKFLKRIIEIICSDKEANYE